MNLILKGFVALGIAVLGFGPAISATAQAQEVEYPLKQPVEQSWSFSGPFGTYNKEQLQRGLKVYKEVCSNCHSLNMVAFRNLEDLGYSPAQVKAFAHQYQVPDEASDSGGTRPAKPSDHFPPPPPVTLNGASPPDMSLLAKARGVRRGFPRFIFDIFTQYTAGGPDYIYNLVTGYGQTPPKGVTIPKGNYYNPYFDAAPSLAMPPPLQDGMVSYDDGAPETVHQYAHDVAAFLMWAAEPHLVARKRTGFVVIIFLIVFSSLLYLVKRKVWEEIEH